MRRNIRNQPCPCSIRTLPLIIGCSDVRYHGPMRRVAYAYQDQGPHGAILSERYWDGVAGHEGNGPTVSSIGPALPSPIDSYPSSGPPLPETRGDSPARTFNYTAMHLHRFSDDSCPTSTISPYLFQQFIQSYTDFQLHTTYLGYDSNWYVNSVQDARGNTTAYTRASPPPTGIGQITKVTHPDTTHIDYTFQSEPGAIGGHYVATVSNERQKVTTYTRDPTTHGVTRIDYPADANTPASYEEFTYNGFGQVLTIISETSHGRSSVRHPRLADG